MSHPDDFDYYLDCGCEIMDHTLGIQKMPDGYHLLLNADQSHYFWMEKSTGRESEIHWDKWACYRGAKSDAILKAKKAYDTTCKALDKLSILDRELI